MDYVQTIIMGIVQGLSEFLPISSSAHLVFTSNLYKTFNGIAISVAENQEIFLDIMLHLGTLIAVLIYFRKEISCIIKAFVDGIKSKDYKNSDFKTGIFILIGTFITVSFAYPLSKIAEKLVFSPQIVGGLLILTGLILFFSEYYSKKHPEKSPVNLKSAISTGIAQGLAVLPGFSRSGLTIATGMVSGSDRESAARYSFLLSIPVILGASMIYPMFKLNFSEILTYNIGAIIVGTIVSGISGFLCIKYFLKFISRFSLKIFGYYCVFAGLFTTIFFSIIK